MKWAFALVLSVMGFGLLASIGAAAVTHESSLSILETYTDKLFLNKEDDFGGGFIQARVDQNTALSANAVELMTIPAFCLYFSHLAEMVVRFNGLHPLVLESHETLTESVQSQLLIIFLTVLAPI